MYLVFFSDEFNGEKHFSYRKLQRGEIVLSGIPEGIDLRKPGNVGPLGKAKCRALLAVEADIRLTG